MSRPLIASAFALLLAAPMARAEIRLGFVDMHRAVGEVEDGKAAKAKLKKEYDLRQKELDEKQEEIKELEANLKAQGDAMSEDAKRKAQEDLDQKVVQVGQLYQKLQKELAAKEQAALKGIFSKMSDIIHNIAETEGLTMVFEKSDSSLLYAKPSLDLTNEVIRRYNTQSGHKSQASQQDQ